MTYIHSDMSDFVRSISKYDKKRIRKTTRFQNAWNLGKLTVTDGYWADPTRETILFTISMGKELVSDFYIRGNSLKETMDPSSFTPSGKVNTIGFSEYLQRLQFLNGSSCMTSRIVTIFREACYSYIYETHITKKHPLYDIWEWVADLKQFPAPRTEGESTNA